MAFSLLSSGVLHSQNVGTDGLTPLGDGRWSATGGGSWILEGGLWKGTGAAGMRLTLTALLPVSRLAGMVSQRPGFTLGGSWVALKWDEATGRAYLLRQENLGGLGEPTEVTLWERAANGTLTPLVGTHRTNQGVEIPNIAAVYTASDIDSIQFSVTGDSITLWGFFGRWRVMNGTLEGVSGRVALWQPDATKTTILRLIRVFRSPFFQVGNLKPGWVLYVQRTYTQGVQPVLQQFEAITASTGVATIDFDGELANTFNWPGDPDLYPDQAYLIGAKTQEGTALIAEPTVPLRWGDEYFFGEDYFEYDEEENEGDVFQYEFQADFASINALLEGTSITRRPGAVSLDYLVAHAPGPIELQDPSQGLSVRAWMARYDVLTGEIWVARDDGAGGWAPETPLLAPMLGIVEMDLAFNQNGDPVICAEKDGHIWLLWFHPINGFGWEDFGLGRTPRVVLDDPFSVVESDIQLFYMSDVEGALMKREQRELYLIPEVCPVVDVELKYVEDAIRGTGLRLHVLYSVYNAVTGRYRVRRISTNPFPPRLSTSLDADVLFLGAELLTVVQVKALEFEGLDALVSFLGAEMLSIVILKDLLEELDAILVFQGAELRVSVLTNEIVPDEIDALTTFQGAELKLVVIHRNQPPDELDASVTFLSGHLESV